MKRLSSILAAFLIIAYLAIALTAFSNKPSGQICQRIDLVIKDNINAGFITQKEIDRLFKSKDIYPVGKKMDDISTKALEDLLDNHPLIDRVECFKTSGGNICVEVSQRIPLLRVMSAQGENYYIDSKGEVMPVHESCVAHRVVVTGYIDKKFAKEKLYPLGLFLQGNKFWDAQIEQINVTTEKEVELVPRVGNHIIFLGRLDSYEEKLSRLKLFYEKCLNQVGWNKYTRINVEFGNQIICTKKD